MRVILLRDEVELDAHLRKLIHVAKLSLLVEAKLFLIIRWLVLNLNVTVVLDTATHGGPDRRSTFDSAEPVSWGERGWDRREKIVDMRRASERLAWAGFLGQRSVQAVEMPVQPTVRARDDRATRSRGRAMALVAEDGLSFGVLQAEIVGRLLVASAIPKKREHILLALMLKWDILWFCRDAAIVLSFGTSFDVDEVFAHIFR
jgi:hypothetical protein